MRKICGVVVGALVATAPAVGAAQGVALAESPPSLTSATNFVNFCTTTLALIGNSIGSCNPAPDGAGK
jgi:hypothetical protein